MQTLVFVVPAHGRLEIAAVCLRQLRRTCDALADRGILASAVVVADDENLEIARAQNFATVERDNTQLGRKLNDGYELAGREMQADFMAPFGNDDWLDPNWILLPGPGETTGTHLSTVVNEDCSRMAALTIRFGDGVRIYSRETLSQVGFRPADEDRNRAMDTTTHNGVGSLARLAWHDTHPLCIVDFKSAANLNDYAGCVSQYGRRTETTDVWGQLAAVYPADAIREMQALHDRGLVAA